MTQPNNEGEGDEFLRIFGEEISIPIPKVTENLLGTDNDLDAFLDCIDLENDEEVVEFLGVMLDD